MAMSWIAAPARAADGDPTSTTVQILGINDFHGRLLPDSFSGNAGAAVLAGAVDSLEATYPDTVFAAAGDLIGASTFESFVAKDKPTIDALNAMDLDVSAVGNHEFDKGYADLTDRVMAPYDPGDQPVRRRHLAVPRCERAGRGHGRSRASGNLDGELW